MIIKINRSVRKLCLLLKRKGSGLPAVRCQTTRPPCCSQTGNALKLLIARVGCPANYWQPAIHTSCEPAQVSECGAMQDLVGFGFIPAIALNCPPSAAESGANVAAVIEYSVSDCAPNGALCFRLDHLLHDQRNGRYHAVISNGVECLWHGQIELGDGSMRLVEYSTESGANCGTC